MSQDEHTEPVQSDTETPHNHEIQENVVPSQLLSPGVVVAGAVAAVLWILAVIQLQTKNVIGGWIDATGGAMLLGLLAIIATTAAVLLVQSQRQGHKRLLEASAHYMVKAAAIGSVVFVVVWLAFEFDEQGLVTGFVLALLASVVAFFAQLGAEARVEPQPSPPEMPPPANYAFYSVKVAKDSKWSPATAISLARALQNKTTEAKTSLDLFISANQKGTEWGLGVAVAEGREEFMRETISDLVGSFYPGAELSMFYVEEPIFPVYRSYMIFKSRGAVELEPTLKASDIKTNDPLAVVTQAMGNLRAGERMEYTLRVGEAVQLSREVIREMLTVSAYDAGHRMTTTSYYRKDFSELMFEGFFNWRFNQQLKKERVLAFSQKDTEKYAARLAEKLSPSYVCLEFDSPHRERVELFSAVASAIIEMTSSSPVKLVGGYHVAENRIETRQQWEEQVAGMQVLHWAVTGAEEMYDHFMTLSAAEIAGLWHLPHQEFATQPIDWLVGGQVPAPQQVKAVTDGVLIGENHYRGETHRILMPDEDRTTHTMIIGKNGTGKSSLMHRLIHEDIHRGRGVCVIDPHGELVANILRSSVPDHRLDDVVVLDLATQVEGLRYPPPLNPLYAGRAASSPDTFVAILSRIYQGFGDTKMARLLKMALITLATEAAPTLWDVRRLFRDDDYRHGLVKQANNLNLFAMWEDFDSESKAAQNSSLVPLFSRLDQFYNSNELLAITCHPDPINIWELVRENRIILVAVGARGIHGEGSGSKIGRSERIILGSWVVSQIEAAAMTGAIQNGPFMLYVDETQNFVTTPLADMLAEVRKFDLGLVLANQFLAQLTGETQDAIEGNVGTMFCFEIGASDAKAMQTYMQPSFQRDDLVALGKFKAAVSMRVGKERQPAFSLNTLPPPSLGLSTADMLKRERAIRRRSIDNYTRKTETEVIDWLHERYLSTPEEPATEALDEEGRDEFIEPATSDPSEGEGVGSIE